MTSNRYVRDNLSIVEFHLSAYSSRWNRFAIGNIINNFTCKLQTKADKTGDLMEATEK